MVVIVEKWMGKVVIVEKWIGKVVIVEKWGGGDSGEVGWW